MTKNWNIYKNTDETMVDLPSLQEIFMISSIRNTGGLAKFIQINHRLRDLAENQFVKTIKARFINTTLCKNIKLEVLNHYIKECNKQKFSLAAKNFEEMRDRISKN